MDAGIGDVARARDLAARATACFPNAGLVVGLDSVVDLDELPVIHQAVPAFRPVFSLDLRQGRPVLAGPAARASLERSRPDLRAVKAKDGRGYSVDAAAVALVDPAVLALVGLAVRAGFRRVLVSDLAAVGTRGGPAGGASCRAVRCAHPEIELVVGGGVRDARDLERLAGWSCDAALVASALQDEHLSPAEVWALERGTRLTGPGDLAPPR